MRGPIDYIIVGFEGNKFDGSILEALTDALEEGTIGVLMLSLISKDKNGVVTLADIEDMGDDYYVEFAKYLPKDKTDNYDQEDIDEMAELLQDNTSAGLLVIEHLWAIPLKEAIVKADGVLVADGRIHPEALAEIEKEFDKVEA